MHDIRLNLFEGQLCTVLQAPAGFVMQIAERWRYDTMLAFHEHPKPQPYQAMSDFLGRRAGWHGTSKQQEHYADIGGVRFAVIGTAMERGRPGISGIDRKFFIAQTLTETDGALAALPKADLIAIDADDIARWQEIGVFTPQRPVVTFRPVAAQETQRVN